MKAVSINNTLLSLFIFFLVTSCERKPEPSSEVLSEDTAQNMTARDKPEVSRTSDTKEGILDKLDSHCPVQVEFLTRFYNDDAYFSPLSFKNGGDNDVYGQIVKAAKEVVFEDDETSRYLIEPELASTHLNADRLNQIVVFDKEQNVVDTLESKRSEYYRDMIFSMFISSYESDLEDEEYIAISLSGLKEKYIKKSSAVFYDSSYLKSVVQVNNLEFDLVDSFINISDGIDTLSILSYVDYKADRATIYLTKNEILRDSINDDFIVTDLAPVPLASKNKIVYLAKCGVPETDVLWDALLTIDLENEKVTIDAKNTWCP